MVYDIEWLEAKRILRLSFYDDISQNDVCRMIDDLHSTLSAAQQTVHIVVELPSGYTYPTSLTSLIPLAKTYYRLPNLGCTMLVTDNMALWTFAKLISQASGKKPRLITARTLEAVLDYLDKKDSSLHLRFQEARAG